MTQQPAESIPSSMGDRLSRYLRVLEAVLEAGGGTVRSRELAEAADLTADQVRKDLSRLGQFGQRGVGYEVGTLVSAIRAALGTDRRRRAAVLGAGRLGQALALHRGFRPRGFDVEAIFDIDPDVVGLQVGALTVQTLATLPRSARALSLEMALLAVPAASAQAALDACAEAGIRGVVSFADVRLTAPTGVVVQEVDLARHLEQLVVRLAQAVDMRPGADAAEL
jgi:redox-sensing transcriptional repressor